MSRRRSVFNLIIISSLLVISSNITLSYLATGKSQWERWLLIGLIALALHTTVLWMDFRLPTSHKAGKRLLLVKVGVLFGEAMLLFFLNDTFRLSLLGAISTFSFLFSSFVLINALGWSPVLTTPAAVGVAIMGISAPIAVVAHYELEIFIPPSPTMTATMTRTLIPATKAKATASLSSTPSLQFIETSVATSPPPILPRPTGKSEPSSRQTSTQPPALEPADTPIWLNPSEQCLEEVYLFAKPILLSPATLCVTHGKKMLSFSWTLANESRTRVKGPFYYRLTFEHMTQRVRHDELIRVGHRHMLGSPGPRGTFKWYVQVIEMTEAGIICRSPMSEIRFVTWE